MRILRRSLTLLFCLAIATPYGAAARTGESDWYSIELIIFARNAADSGLTEEWPQDQAIPDWSTSTPLTSRPLGSLEAPQPALTAIAFAPRSTYKLSGITNRLNKTGDRLEPLLHLAWRQPVTSSKKAENLYLQVPFDSSDTTFTAAPPRLEGVIKVSRSRYLHVNLDLFLRSPVSQGYSEPGYPAIGGYGYSPFTHYRMQDHRRMRSGELHYIDHPMLGIMVRIDPYQPPEPPKPTPAADTPQPATENATPSEAVTPAEEKTASPSTSEI